MKTSSKLVVAALAALTLAGSAGSAFADRNMYTRNHSGRRQAYFHRHYHHGPYGYGYHHRHHGPYGYGVRPRHHRYHGM